ncbi:MULTISPECIES: PRD domain-containing protein [unclassified Brachybacterium]|uniref:PRD domain-containing protein n=1 Tax=unclassified Brachybacterium TaxID=2623841 RepID=UPI00360919B9
MAGRIVEFVDRRTGGGLPDGEAVPVALYLVTAGFSGGYLSSTYRMTGMISQLFDVLDQVLHAPIDRDSVNAARFIAHLRYFFVRAHEQRQLDDDSDRLGGAVREAFPEAYAAARRLRMVMELRLGQALSDAELTYLTVHVARMVDEAGAEQ